jgi:hypothetical protein
MHAVPASNELTSMHDSRVALLLMDRGSERNLGLKKKHVTLSDGSNFCQVVNTKSNKQTSCSSLVKARDKSHRSVYR